MRFVWKDGFRMANYGILDMELHVPKDYVDLASFGMTFIPLLIQRRLF